MKVEQHPPGKVFNRKKGKRFGPSHSPSGSMAPKTASADNQFIFDFVQNLTNSIIATVCENQDDEEEKREERKISKKEEKKAKRAAAIAEEKAKKAAQQLPKEFFDIGAASKSGDAQ